MYHHLNYGMILPPMPHTVQHTYTGALKCMCPHMIHDMPYIPLN